MISNIPIYRAKKINSYEYVEGFLKNCTDTGLDVFWIQSKEFVDYKIDIDTLSIHFNDMLDSQGNKIFASLQEDGRGGDMVDLPDYLKAEKDTERIAVVIMKSFNEYIAFCKNGAIYRSCHFVGNSKVIGIQE